MSCQKHTKPTPGVIGYLLDPSKHYHSNPCQIDFGVTGGNNVSVYTGNLVDLESELFNITRNNSDCSCHKFQKGTIIQGLSSGKPQLRHLPTCTLINYKPRPKNVGYKVNYDACCNQSKY